MLKQAALNSATNWVKSNLESKASLLDVADKQFEVPKVSTTWSRNLHLPVLAMVCLCYL